MAGGGAKPRNLILTTKYSGFRAIRYFSNDSEQATRQLKLDLEYLRFPSPRVQNIRFVSHGCMEAIYPDPNDAICRSLQTAVYQLPSKSGPFGLYKPRDLDDLNIVGFGLKPTLKNATETWGTGRTQSRSSSAAGPSNSSSAQTSRPPTQPRHRIRRKSGPFSLPARPQTQAQIQQSRTSTPQEHRQSMSSTSNSVLQGVSTSAVKRPAEDHELNQIPNKRVKIDPVPGSTTSSGNGTSALSRNPSSAAQRNSETPVPTNSRVTQTNATNAKFASPAGSSVGQHNQIQLSSLASSSSSSLVNAAVSSLPQQVLQTPQSSPMSISPDQTPTTMSTAQGDRLENQAIEQHTIVPIDQSQQGPSTNHLDSTTSTTKDQIKALERQLFLVRRELKEKGDQELKLYQLIQETDATYKPTYQKCSNTRFKDIQQALKERDKRLEEAQQTAAIAEKVLENEREYRKQIEEELQEERKVQAEIEGRLKAERDKRIQLEGELSGERTKRTEAEEELQKEGKLRIKVEDALMKSNMVSQAMKTSRDKAFTLWESMDKEVESLKQSLEMERTSQVALQAKMESEKAKNDELGQRLDKESKRRAELEEELEKERGHRLRAEAMLKDVERECRAPFIVPALLEAFATISNLTTQAVGADAMPKCK